MVVLTATNRTSAIPSLVVSGTLLMVLWTIGCVYTSRRAKLAVSFEVAITPESVTRRHLNTAELTLNQDEIGSIQLAPHALLIHSKNKNDLPLELSSAGK